MKLLRKTLVAIPAVYLGVFGLVALQQRAMIYAPRAALATPAEAGLAGVETLRLETTDGEKVEAWFHPPRAPDRPLILYFHGNGGALIDRRDRFATLIAHGYGLLATSWRGFGASTGTPSEAGLLLDAEAAYAEAIKRGYPPERIVLMGESLGTGVATMIAARHDAAALVLDSPYDSILALAAMRFPYFPVSLALIDTFRADEAIEKVKAPVLMIVAEGDPVTPATNARRLFERAQGAKQMITVPGVRHTALSSPGAGEKMMQWIDETLKSGSGQNQTR
jgi:fermentation-respiration switch protein FrsA (DUF1100 family)